MAFSPFTYRLSIALLSASAFITFPFASPAQIPTSAETGIIARTLEQDDPSRRDLRAGDIVLPKMDEPAIGGSTQKVFVLNNVVLDGSTCANDFLDNRACQY